jgi:hypothetical protein
LSFSKTVLLVAGLGCAPTGEDAINARDTNTNAPREIALRVIMDNILLVGLFSSKIEAAVGVAF